jgi:hypothetical protein
MAFLAVIVLAMTAMTHNLDDIKKALFYPLGAILAAAGIGSILLGRTPLPHRWVGWGLAAYGIVLVLSTLFSEFSWAGRSEIIFLWACFGFFLGGMAIGSMWRTMWVFLVFAVSLVLLVNFLGYFQYDFLGTNRTGTMWLSDHDPQS